jgi:hypothetical protein
MSKEDAIALGTINVQKLLGLDSQATNSDLVATIGGDLMSFEGKVIAIIAPRRQLVEIL